jgi:hypothetical protein
MCRWRADFNQLGFRDMRCVRLVLLSLVGVVATGLAAMEGIPPFQVDASERVLGIATGLIGGLLVLQIVLTVKDLWR